MRLLTPILLASVVAAAPALGQGSASIGRSTGVVHGQSWNAGQQDLSGYGTSSGGRQITRSQALRQRSAAVQGQTTRPSARTTTRRTTAQRSTAGTTTSAN